MKLMLYLDTPICLDADAPETDLIRCLSEYIYHIANIYYIPSLNYHDITVISGLQDAILASTRRGKYCEKNIYIPEGTVLTFDIPAPTISVTPVQYLVAGINDGTFRIGHNRSLGYGLCHVHDQFDPSLRKYTRYVIEATVLDGLLVQGGVTLCNSTEDTVFKDSTFAKDILGRDVVPATAIKGAIRAQCQRLVKYFHISEDIIDYMFGNFDKGIDACVIFYDALIENAREEVLFRCHVDKLTGGIFGDGSGQMKEVYMTGGIKIFLDYIPIREDVYARNIHKLLLCICQDIQQKRLSFGRGRGIGKGFLDVNRLTIALPQPQENDETEIAIDYRINEVIDPSGWLPRQWDNEITNNKASMDYDQDDINQ